MYAESTTPSHLPPAPRASSFSCSTQKALICGACILLASHGERQVVMTGRLPALIEALKARDVSLLEAYAGGKAVARCLAEPNAAA